MTDHPPRRMGLVGHDAAIDTLLVSLLAELPEHEPGQTQGLTADDPAGSTPQATSAALLQSGSAPPASRAQRSQGQPPVWATGPLRVLLFGIGGMSFAAPLVMLRAVTELTQSPQPLPGQPTWHRGLVQYRGKSLLVADPVPLLGIRAHSAKPRYLLVMGDGEMALACDALGEAVTTDAGAVRWRHGSDDRAWLAGMLPGQMCALLDVVQIEQKIRHG